MSDPPAEVPDPPQWVKSRLESIKQRPECTTSHYACRCFLERIVKLEAEVSRLREQAEGGGSGE